MYVPRAPSSALVFLPGPGILTSFYTFSCSRVSKLHFPFSCCSFACSPSLWSGQELWLCSAAKVHDMSTWADRELWKAQGQFCSVTLVSSCCLLLCCESDNSLSFD